MKKLKFLIIFIFCPLLIFSQQKNEKIIWGKSLTWNDFKGQPDYSIPHNASAQTGLSASFSWKIVKGEPQLQYKIYAIFNPLKSWVKPGKESLRLLQHEQLHFDISELTAREFRKYLSEQNIKPDKMQQKIDRKGELLKRKNKRIQDRYDRQTKHGTDLQKQEKWEIKIHQKLKKLRAFRQPQS